MSVYSGQTNPSSLRQLGFLWSWRQQQTKMHFERICVWLPHFSPFYTFWTLQLSLRNSSFCLLLAKKCWLVGAPLLTKLTSVTVSRRICDSVCGSTITEHNYLLISACCFYCKPSLCLVKSEAFSSPATLRVDVLAEVMWHTQLILRRWLVKGWHEKSAAEWLGRLVMPSRPSEIS